MVLGVCKNIGVTPDYILYEMTYENVLMYSHATPTYESDDDITDDNKKNGFRPELDANNPDNFNNLDDDDMVTDLRTL